MFRRLAKEVQLFAMFFHVRLPPLPPSFSSPTAPAPPCPPPPCSRSLVFSRLILSQMSYFRFFNDVLVVEARSSRYLELKDVALYVTRQYLAQCQISGYELT